MEVLSNSFFALVIANTSVEDVYKIRVKESFLVSNFSRKALRSTVIIRSSNATFHQCKFF